MGYTTTTPAAAYPSLDNMHPYPNRPVPSSTASSKATTTHAPLSPYSATHSTFHRPTSASTTHCPARRNPLNPSYSLPTYPIYTPPPPPFVHSSLDIADISRTRTQQRATMHTRDHINVHDIDGAQTKQQQRTHSKPATALQQPYQAAEPTGLLHYVRPAVVDTTDIEQPDDASEPFSPHFTSSIASSSPTTPASPPSRPRSSPPSTTAQAAHRPAYRSPYTRFSHSPHVLTLPTTAFAELYHVAVPSTDPLPAFRCTLHRTSALPSNCAPMGGVDGRELDEIGGSKTKGRGGGVRRRSKRMKGVSARVQCWRASEGEVERSAAHISSGASGGGEWRRIRVQDIELVSSLTL